MKYYVLYNPLSDNNMGKQNAEAVNKFYPNDQLEFVNVLENSFENFFGNNANANVIICGGDGTLNYFVNEVDCDKIKEQILYYATGSGNDFLTDIGGKKGEKPIEIGKYLVNLPTVEVNGITKKFINGIGYGIDGYCCEVADILKQKSNKPINYTSIAIKGLLFNYKPTFATVTVDDKTFTYKKTWICPTMNGRHYGGGMIPTPNQNRLGDGSLSVMTMFGKGRLATLMAFPTIFKGEHVKKTDMVAVNSGKKITVKYDRPVALQIDGETVLNVTEYTVKAYNA